MEDALSEVLQLRNRLISLHIDGDALFLADSMIELLKNQLAYHLFDPWVTTKPLNQLDEAMVARAAYISKFLNDRFPPHDPESSNATRLVLNNVDLLNTIIAFCWSSNLRPLMYISKAFNKVVIAFVWANAAFFIKCPSHAIDQHGDVVLKFNRAAGRDFGLELFQLENLRFAKCFMVSIWKLTVSTGTFLYKLMNYLDSVTTLRIHYYDPSSIPDQLIEWVEAVCCSQAHSLKEIHVVAEDGFLLSLIRKHSFRQTLSRLSKLDVFSFNSGSNLKMRNDILTDDDHLADQCLAHIPAQVRFLEWEAMSCNGFGEASKYLNMSNLSRFNLSELKLEAVLITLDNLPAFGKAIRFVKLLDLFRVKLPPPSDVPKAEMLEFQRNLPVETLEDLDVHFGFLDDGRTFLDQYLFPHDVTYAKLRKLSVLTWVSYVWILQHTPNLEVLKLSREKVVLRDFGLLPNLGSLKVLHIAICKLEGCSEELVKKMLAKFPSLERCYVGSLRLPKPIKKRNLKQLIKSGSYSKG
jgi:hypothetical protein